MTGFLYRFFLAGTLALLIFGCAGSQKNASEVPWVKYEMETFSRGVSTPDSAAGVHVVIQYPKIMQASHHGVDRYINLYIDSVMHAHFGDVGKVFNYNQIIDKFFSDYETFMKDFPEGHMAGWYDEAHCRVVCDTMGILGLQFDYTGYTGGAHGYSETDYANFNLSNGRMLSLWEILLPGYEHPLTKIAEAAFRRMRDLAPDSSLEAAGFWFKDNVFSLNDNFSIRNDKIVFFYNDYEIAPHSLGPTEVVIPYSELRDLIDPKGPLGFVK